MITEVTQTLCFYGQKANKQDELEDLTNKLREYFAATPPTAGAYKREYMLYKSVKNCISLVTFAYLAKRNDICAAIFPEDGQWYRGKVEKATRDGSEATITFIDYGNRAQVSELRFSTKY